MDDPTDIEREYLAAEFQHLLIQELDRRQIPYRKVECRDIGVNLDVYIYHPTESFWYDFKYLGWGWLVHRIIPEKTLEGYIKEYAARYLSAIRQQYEWQLRQKSEYLKRGDLRPQHKESCERDLRDAKMMVEKIKGVKP